MKIQEFVQGTFKLISVMSQFLYLRRQTVCSLETSVAVYQVTWHYITEDCDLHCHCLYSHECFIKYISFCLKLPLEVKVKQVNVSSDRP